MCPRSCAGRRGNASDGHLRKTVRCRCGALGVDGKRRGRARAGRWAGRVLDGRVGRSTAHENADVRAAVAARSTPSMNSWAERERARQTLAKEVGYVVKPHGDRLRVALAFPNTYWVGMSNLGFQTVYRLFNAQDDIVCERFFLPPKQELKELLATNTRLVTLESQTPVADFDVIAFSVSFEWDYVNVLTLLRLAGIPRYAAERTERHPLVVIGGAVTFVNPEPLAPFADAIAAGEGEVLVPGRRRAFRAAGDRAELLSLLARERGFYVPSFYEPRYAADGSLAGYQVIGGGDGASAPAQPVR